MLQKHKISLFQQLVLKGVYKQVFPEEAQDSWENRDEHSCRDPDGFMTGSLAQDSDREEHC